MKTCMWCSKKHKEKQIDCPKMNTKKEKAKERRRVKKMMALLSKKVPMKEIEHCYHFLGARGLEQMGLGLGLS